MWKIWDIRNSKRAANINWWFFLDEKQRFTFAIFLYLFIQGAPFTYSAMNTKHYLDGTDYQQILPWYAKNTTNNYISHHINSVTSGVYLITVSGCFILPKNGSEAVCHSISFILSSEWLDWLEKNVDHCCMVWLSFLKKSKQTIFIFRLFWM